MKNRNQLISLIRAVFLEIDPMNIYFEEDQNTDEYDFEIKEIVSFLPNCKTESELKEKINNLFIKAFGKDNIRFNNENSELPKRIWDLYTKY